MHSRSGYKVKVAQWKKVISEHIVCGIISTEISFISRAVPISAKGSVCMHNPYSGGGSPVIDNRAVIIAMWLYNNNNNNNPICKAPECQKTSVALNVNNSNMSTTTALRLCI